MDHERLFMQVADALNAILTGFEELTGGSSANVWRLDLRDDEAARPVVFRQHQASELKDHDAGVARMEYQLLGQLSELGFPVAKPLHLDEAHQFLVTEFVAGESAVDATAVVSAIEQMADLLGRLHSLDISLVDTTVLTALEDPVERLRTCLPSTAHGDRLRSLIDTDHFTLHTNEPVLLHGDYWPGNVLWASDTLAALIDWEDACVGDPLADLATARVELLCAYGQAAMDDFSARYLNSVGPLDTQSLPLWECYVSATALASMHLWGLEPSEQAQRRTLTEAFFDAAVEALHR